MFFKAVANVFRLKESALNPKNFVGVFQIEINPKIWKF